MTAPRFKPLILAGLLMIAFASVAMPPVVADHGVPHEANCEGRVSSASISNVAANGVTLNTGLMGPTTLELPRKLLSLAVSSTGSLQVDVTHDCIRYYELTATVIGTISGTNTYTFTATPGCVGGVDTWNVPVGNDLADVNLVLKWIGCDGSTGTDQRDIHVVDPAVPSL